jgi:hypothetical protein
MALAEAGAPGRGMPWRTAPSNTREPGGVCVCATMTQSTTTHASSIARRIGPPIACGARWTGSPHVGGVLEPSSLDEQGDAIYPADSVRILTWVVSLVGLLLVSASAIAAPPLPACLDCTDSSDCCTAEPCLRGPCGGYLGCIQDAQSQYDDCISGLSDNVNCRSTAGGRCTIILGCVRNCQRDRNSKMQKCRKDNFRDLSGECTACTKKLKSRSQRALAQICKSSCSNPTPTTTTVVTTTSTSTSTTGATTSATTSTSTSTTPPPTFTCEKPGIDRCTFECLLRISSLKNNYNDCENKCEGNGCAEIICKENARNIACLAIRARCSSNGQNIDPDFIRCCGVDCPAADEAPCRILPTTTSTTKMPTTTTPTTTTGTTSSTTLPVI